MPNAPKPAAVVSEVKRQGRSARPSAPRAIRTPGASGSARRRASRCASMCSPSATAMMATRIGRARVVTVILCPRTTIHDMLAAMTSSATASTGKARRTERRKRTRKSAITPAPAAASVQRLPADLLVDRVPQRRTAGEMRLPAEAFALEHGAHRLHGQAPPPGLLARVQAQQQDGERTVPRRKPAAVGALGEGLAVVLARGEGPAPHGGVEFLDAHHRAVGGDALGRGRGANGDEVVPKRRPERLFKGQEPLHSLCGEGPGGHREHDRQRLAGSELVPQLVERALLRMLRRQPAVAVEVEPEGGRDDRRARQEPEAEGQRAEATFPTQS